jgi:hypothetical protein
MPLYLEKADLAFNAQMKNLASKIGKYATVLEISPTELASLQADAAAVDYVVSNQGAVQSFAQQFTSYKRLLLLGGSSAQAVVPEVPVLGQAPAMPKYNVKARLRFLLQRISHHPAFNKGISEDLGIEAPQQKFVPTAGKPLFKVQLASGGYPKLRWKKKKYQGVEIWKDAGQGFAKLDRDMIPDYVDKSALPAAGQSATWKYKMIYLLDDEHCGSWSDEVSAIVHGAV